MQSHLDLEQAQKCLDQAMALYHKNIDKIKEHNQLIKQYEEKYSAQAITHHSKQDINKSKNNPLFLMKINTCYRILNPVYEHIRFLLRAAKSHPKVDLILKENKAKYSACRSKAIPNYLMLLVTRQHIFEEFEKLYQLEYEPVYSKISTLTQQIITALCQATLHERNDVLLHAELSLISDKTLNSDTINTIMMAVHAKMTALNRPSLEPIHRYHELTLSKRLSTSSYFARQELFSESLKRYLIQQIKQHDEISPTLPIR